MFCHICIRFKPYNEGTRKGVNNYMTDSYFFFPVRKFQSGILSLVLEGLLLCELIFLSVSPSQSASSIWYRRGRLSFSSLIASSSETSDPDWNYMSFSSNIVQMSSTEFTFSLSCQRGLSFLSDSWRLIIDCLSATSLRTYFQTFYGHT